VFISSSLSYKLGSSSAGCMMDPCADEEEGVFACSVECVDDMLLDKMSGDLAET
jgi:hypothetical protein